MASTPYLIRLFRTLRLFLHFVWMGLGTALIYPRVSDARRMELRQIWSHKILKILAIRLEAPPMNAPPGSLIVANHISWLDVFAINSVRPSAFIAKAEIRRWPFFGWLTARHGSIFLRRGSRGHARVVNQKIDALLVSGKNVALFPEGRTTDGRQVLGFHAALLEPAIAADRPIIPLALSYFDASGTLSQAPSFAGEISLLQCFLSILASRSLILRLAPLPLILPAGLSRREVSLAAHDAILGALRALPGFHPLRTPPEK